MEALPLSLAFCGFWGVPVCRCCAYCEYDRLVRHARNSRSSGYSPVLDVGRFLAGLHGTNKNHTRLPAFSSPWGSHGLGFGTVCLTHCFCYTGTLAARPRVAQESLSLPQANIQQKKQNPRHGYHVKGYLKAHPDAENFRHAAQGEPGCVGTTAVAYVAAESLVTDRIKGFT